VYRVASKSLIDGAARTRRFSLFLNPYNWLALLRVFLVFAHPGQFFWAIVGRKILPNVEVKTPIGRVCVEMRNFESLRTLFSTFCRRDYLTSIEPAVAIMDCGANIGIASLYFLSRNVNNRVICFEPDRANTDYLKRNLRSYMDRVVIHEVALATEAGSATLFRAEDGKYSSLIASDKADQPDQIMCVKFEDGLREVIAAGLPVVVKLDVEGLEVALVESVEWDNFPEVRAIISESTGCSNVITRQHRRKLHSGFVEHLIF
jgi:FkbM family methyltransferase